MWPRDWRSEGLWLPRVCVPTAKPRPPPCHGSEAGLQTGVTESKCQGSVPLAAKETEPHVVADLTKPHACPRKQDTPSVGATPGPITSSHSQETARTSPRPPPDWPPGQRAGPLHRPHSHPGRALPGLRHLDRDRDSARCQLANARCQPAEEKGLTRTNVLSPPRILRAADQTRPPQHTLGTWVLSPWATEPHQPREDLHSAFPSHASLRNRSRGNGTVYSICRDSQKP